MAGKEVFNLSGATRKGPLGSVPPSPLQAWQLLSMAQSPFFFPVGALTLRSLARFMVTTGLRELENVPSAVCKVTSAF